MKNLLYKLKSNNLDLNEAQIEGLLYLILNDSSLTNTSLITQTGLPKETLKSFKASISSFLEDPVGDEVKFNSEGISQISELKLKPYLWCLLDFDDDLGEALIAKFQELASLRKDDPSRELDQFFATIETSLKKALILEKKGQIFNKSILILGDDDLVSIAISLVNKDFSEIVVLDVDSNILSTIEKLSEKLDLQNKIKVFKYDVRKDLKSAMVKKFDVVVTDPPYTSVGVDLFLNRGLLGLKYSTDFSGPYVFLYFGNSFKEPEKTLKLQEIFQKYNLVLEEKISNFAQYNGAESIGNTSSLYILRKTVHTEVLSKKVFSEIYTYETIEKKNFPYVDHYTFKLFDVPQQIINSKKSLQKNFGQFCNWHKFNVVDFKLTKFKGGGITLTYVLAQSNLVVHTWPEFGAIHVDLITCEPIAKKDRLVENLSLLFKTLYIESSKIE